MPFKVRRLWNKCEYFDSNNAKCFQISSCDSAWYNVALFKFVMLDIFSLVRIAEKQVLVVIKHV